MSWIACSTWASWAASEEDAAAVGSVETTREP
jgi:hypothetical protein